MLRVLIAGCVLAAFAGAAVADKPKKPDAPDANQTKADVLFEKGQARFQAGEYQAAIELFQSAYNLVHDPTYLFNMAQSYRKVLDCEHASEFYSRYLAEDQPEPALKKKVEGWIRELEPCVEERKADRDKAKQFEDAQREKERQQREAAERKAREAATPHTQLVDGGRTLRIAGIATAATGAAMAIAGTVFAIQGKHLKDQVAADCAMGCDWADEVGRDSTGTRDNRLAVIGWIGGGLAIAGGVGLYLWGRSKIETVQIGGTESSATVSVRGRF